MTSPHPFNPVSRHYRTLTPNQRAMLQVLSDTVDQPTIDECVDVIIRHLDHIPKTKLIPALCAMCGTYAASIRANSDEETEVIVRGLYDLMATYSAARRFEMHQRG